jgi:hypothetical protein
MDLNLEGVPVVSEFTMRLVPIVAVRQNVYPVKGKAWQCTVVRRQPRCG